MDVFRRFFPKNICYVRLKLNMSLITIKSFFEDHNGALDRIIGVTVFCVGFLIISSGISLEKTETL